MTRAPPFATCLWWFTRLRLYRGRRELQPLSVFPARLRSVSNKHSHPDRTTDIILSYPGYYSLVPRILFSRTTDIILSYHGYYSLVPRILFSRTTDIILSYHGYYSLVPRILFSRAPDIILSCPGYYSLVPRISIPLVPEYAIDTLIFRICTPSYRTRIV